MQDRLDKLEHDYEDLIERVRLADQQRFGRHTEKLSEIAGQLSFFNEAEGNCDESRPEPTIGETVAAAVKPPRKSKKKGQRAEDLKDLPQEEVEHDVPREELSRAFGEGILKVCRMRSSGSCVLNRPGGSLKSMWSKCMSAQTDRIRMNSSAGIILPPCFVEALQPLPWKRRSSMQSTSTAARWTEYFAWIKDVFSQGLVLPKSETAKGLSYSINQEEYLKVFLTDGEVPIDDPASEGALRNFTIGRKNWVTINTVRGAQASAVIYSITETARANDLNVYYYIRHLLTELPQLIREDGTIGRSMLEPLMPWSETLPADRYSKRRK